jgi:nucleoside-diphosphate-sugar epimerase
MLQHQNPSPKLPKRVVVVGAAGFVGSALVETLKARGASVLPLTRRDIDLLAPDAQDKLASMLRPDDTFVAVAARAPCKNVQMLTENMKIVESMVGALTKSPVSHLVNISSDAVYADSPDPLTEKSVTAPTSLHGVMHLARELAFQDVRAPFVTLRPSLLYGVADPHNGYGPNRFRRLANEGKEIVLFGEGEERRDHVSIEDVAELIARVIERRSTGSLNIATGKVHSFREIAELVTASASKKVPIKGSPRSGPMPHNGYRPFDNASTRAAFPDFTYTTLPDGIARAQHAEGSRNA